MVSTESNLRMYDGSASCMLISACHVSAMNVGMAMSTALDVRCGVAPARGPWAADPVLLL